MFLGTIFAVILLAFLGALYYGYRLAFYYQDPMEDPCNYPHTEENREVEARLDRAIRQFQAAPFETVSIRSQDGKVLTGRYYQVSQGAPLLIQMHGYKGNAIRDFCGAWGIAQERKHNVLLVDQRCHRTSEDHTITFGIREHQDCLSWVQYACGRFGSVPMVLMGVSMGAATVLMVAGKELPHNVKGIIADCPYDAPANIIKKVLGVEMGMPVKLVYPLIRLGGILYGRFDLESSSPLEAVQKARIPILLLHGDADDFVPHEMSCNLHKAAPENIAFHTIPGSGHAMNQMTDPALYHSIVVPFLEKIV